MNPERREFLQKSLLVVEGLLFPREAHSSELESSAYTDASVFASAHNRKLIKSLDSKLSKSRIGQQYIIGVISEDTGTKESYFWSYLHKEGGYVLACKANAGPDDDYFRDLRCFIDGKADGNVEEVFGSEDIEEWRRIWQAAKEGKDPLSSVESEKVSPERLDQTNQDYESILERLDKGYQ